MTTLKTLKKERVVIIGAGAAGLMAAGSIQYCDITVLDGNEKAGKKIYITGKGRCNVTNDCTPAEFFNSVVTNPKFLFSCIYGFTPQDTKELLDSFGVPTKTERGNRVFPVSDKSSDVIKALYGRAQKNGAKFRFNEKATCIERERGGFRVHTELGEYPCEKLLLATGGKSYPATGSTGDGYCFAKSLGHTIIEPKPSLVPLLIKQDVSPLAGLTLKNVSVTVKAQKKAFKQFGELLFTHRGVSGPTVLSLSAYIAKLSYPAELCIDLKPALDFETLDKRIVKDFSEASNKQLKNALGKLLPCAIIPYVIEQSKLSANRKVNEITKEERQAFVYAVKNLRFDVSGAEQFENAVVTSGGVSVKEIEPRTMESRIIKNLYFAGEVIDVDALTGGYNLQIAFATAHAAAKAISAELA
ncbi:NAD(P)/FAD-dependent oxidoreductase [Pumilibacter muris]|uniref:NAD(P)/FAD-dependent oxidoreductase n=1 Tax=Pumilibacter muris TaxID=2941510 RepID=UPI002040A0E5|nr:NAD(P)/FAD-dependent oxidoreductase [Pumilibacter muris]